MAISQFPKSPNKVHPTIPNAVGSRESLAQEGRDKVAEAKLVLDETTDKVLNHIMNKLPDDVLSNLDVMAGHGGKNIIGNVKRSIKKYIDNLEDGDRVTFITFDSTVKIYPTVYVDDDNDRDILKKYISMIEPKGKWTHTYKMIKSVFQKADELESKNEDLQTVIIVMTDALDDPPPHKVREKFNIKKIANKYQDKNWWIYFVKLSDLKKNKKVTEREKKFASELKKVSKHTKIIEAGKDPEKGIEKDLPEDVKRLESESAGIIIPLIIAIIIIGIILGVIIFFVRLSKIKVTGRLEFWNNAVLDPYIQSFDMTQRNLREVAIGKGVGIALIIRDIDISGAFLIKAVKVGNLMKLELSSSKNVKIEFVNKESGYLENGDMFKVENFTFKYFQ